MGMDGNVEERMTTSEYLAQLLKDKKQLQSFPNAFVHLERILDDEIRRVRGNVFCISGSESLHLPEPLGPVVTLCEKIIIPTKEFPEFNFIGRLLGPRGMTAKQLELDTGCKILVRGQGSMRDKQKEEQMKGKPKWEHLNEELHVLITVEDSKNRATVKLRRAFDEVKKLLVPVPECDDELKKRQLIELAVLNGTYRGLNGINGIFVSAAANGTQSLGSNFMGTHMAIGPPFSFAPHDLVMGSHVAMGPTMLPFKSSHDQAGAPILLASPPPPTPHHNPHHNPPMTMYTGALTPLPSPGPMTPIQSPGVMGGIAQPLLLPCSEGGLIYHFNPCIVPPHSSQAYEYPLSPVHPPSFGLSVGH